MATTQNITQAMNNISLEEEEEGGVAFEEIEGEEEIDALQGLNIHLCLVGRFINEGVVDFTAMKHTLASIWKPGKGVSVKEIDVNLYIFQFYHELDIKRVIQGSPWTFNRKVLIIARMKEGDVPRGVSLNNLDLWVQIYDMQTGLMTERVLKEVGNYVGEYVESYSRNFTGVWREYMRIRVTIDITKPLKRRMKIRKAGGEWLWITFKYENVPTFCFICGLVGHSEKFCNKLFDTPEEEIARPYGAWMRAPFRKQNKLVGSRWLRDGDREEDGDRNTVNEKSGEAKYKGKQTPQILQIREERDNQGDTVIIDKDMGANIASSNKGVILAETSKSNPLKTGVIVVDNKKRRIIDGSDQHIGLCENPELFMGSDGESMDGLDQDDPKNALLAGSGT